MWVCARRADLGGMKIFRCLDSRLKTNGLPAFSPELGLGWRRITSAHGRTPERLRHFAAGGRTGPLGLGLFAGAGFADEEEFADGVDANEPF